MTHLSVSTHYRLNSTQEDASAYVQTILDNTPLPKGRDAFTSIHVVGPTAALGSTSAESTMSTIAKGSEQLGRECKVHRLDISGTTDGASAMEEYTTIFETASSLLLEKADRVSLLIFVGWEESKYDAYAAFIGMLPFRGIQVALISQRQSHEGMLHYTTPSGTFDLDGLCSARMGKFTVHAVFGELPSKKIVETVKPWRPVDISSEKTRPNVVEIPFKIGGLSLPMLTHNGSSDEALESLRDLLNLHYPKGYTPIVSVGETCDAMGYGQDMLDGLNQEDGMLYAHKSGETYKRYDNYGTPELFNKINEARKGTAPPVILAVGGGVNGNCIGLIAALTNCDFFEIPTTPMHYNDAVTSAKKAFSLVINDKIMSKNILGAFYLPQMAFCVNEWLLTISSASAHATVGEATKTMNMLGISNSNVGARDFHNILGAVEFASDFTKILSDVGGFDNLINFIESSSTQKKKKQIISLGKKIAALRDADTKPEKDESRRFGRIGKFFGSLPSMVTLSSMDSGSESSSDSEDEQVQDLQTLMQERKELMENFRATFYNLPKENKNSILSFLTTINREIVCAKAMFLAYSDPFEKYRALLFEYAHTLGHGVEAFVNDLYLKARLHGVDIPTEAIRLHGQCVGMAVLWAGEMSRELGKLEGDGYKLHQSLPYLFNRAEGFSFMPIRDLCDELGVSKEEFLESVLQVVRRDNKRGYCVSSDKSKSVDQLVTQRPGKMLASADPNAEIRYLVEVDEDWQRNVLDMAFDGYFDKVADLRNGDLTFVPTESITRKNKLQSSSVDVAAHIRSSILSAYQADVEAEM